MLKLTGNSKVEGKKSNLKPKYKSERRLSYRQEL